MEIELFKLGHILKILTLTDSREVTIKSEQKEGVKNFTDLTPNV